MYTHIDQPLVNSMHGLFNCEIGGLDCRVIIEYRARANEWSHYQCHCMYSTQYGVPSKPATILRVYLKRVSQGTRMIHVFAFTNIILHDER